MGFFVRKDYKKVILYLGVTAVILFLMKCVLPYFWPLAVAMLIVVPLQRCCMRNGNKKNSQKTFMAGGILFAILLLLAILLVGIGTFFISNFSDFIKNLNALEREADVLLTQICQRLELLTGLEEGIMKGWLYEKINSWCGNFANDSNVLIKSAAKYVAGMGKALAFCLVSFISVVLLAREIEVWQQGLLYVSCLEPAIDKILSIILRIGKKLGKMIKTFLKTQSIILCCISITAMAGLYAAGVREAWFYGLLAGLMDVLPFIGTGIVLVPIGVVRLIGGSWGSGLIVLVTYLLCVGIREFLEPRLMGNGMRLSPVAILISVYAGVGFYGVTGVILGPVTLLILVETAREIFL